LLLCELSRILLDVNEKGLKIALVVVMGLAIGLAYWLWRSHSPVDLTAREVSEFVFGKGPCPGPLKTTFMRDSYMKNLISKGQKIKVQMNHYACHDIAVGDVVFYRFSSKAWPVVKRVVAIAGDSIRLSPDRERRAWNLLVNEKLVNGDSKDPYFFGTLNVLPPIGLTLKLSSKLRKDEVILLSGWAPGEADSGMFGVVNKVDVIGKVILN
jgi:hypothetical protein